MADADEGADGEYRGPVIDAHLHADSLDPLLRHQADRVSGVTLTPAGLAKEMRANGVVHAINLGFETKNGETSREAANPMGLTAADDRAKALPNLSFVGGVNPYRLDDEGLARIDKALAAKTIIGVKIYLGYYHLPPDDDRYKRVYELAGKRDVPVILHTGDTYSAGAKVRFAHPLPIDDMAVDFRNVTFVLAHLGNPWTIDAAELLYKNPNVYADLSGFLVGDAKYFADPQSAEGIEHAVERIRRAFAWVEDPKKFLYGSDWPLAPMAPYLAFVRRAIPREHHRAVFYENVRRVFKLEMKSGG